MKKAILIVLVLVLGVVEETAKADFTFGTPTKVPNINTSSREFKPSISADGLSLYLISNRPGGLGGFDIWVATRETTDDPWDTPVNLGSTINTSDNEWGVSISSDGLSLYYDIKQPGASGAIDDIWVATRETTDDDWGNPVSLGPIVNSSADDCYACISADGLELYFSSPRSGGYGNYDLWVTKRETTEDDWGAPVNLGPTINSSGYEVDPSISADGRVLFFTIGVVNCGSRCGYGGTEIWMTRRATTDDDWSEPVNLGPTINSSAFEDYENVSADGSTLFFRYSQSGRYSGCDIWQAPIIPIVDFNADGIVDTADMDIMVDHWHTDEPTCDIGPMPWGDGIVDAQDMLVLTEYMTEEKVDVDADAIYKEMCDLYTLAVETGDLDLYVDVYTNDAVQIPPDAPIRIGSAQVRAAMEPALALFDIICPIYPQEATVNGNWAFGRCDWSLSLTPKEGGATTIFNGRSIDILKRQPDGSWKFYMSCWNYDGPPTVVE
jgi:ketosteroid isomerase-like protein